MSLSVICTKWGSNFSAEYVNRMRAQVEKYLTVPHEFWCFTDNPEGIDSGTNLYPIEQLWGNRAKFVDSVPHGGYGNLVIFSKDFPLKGHILYLDLDTIILKNIDELITYGEKSEFTAIWDWWSKDWNGSVNLFEAGFRPQLWEYATPIDNGQKWFLKMISHAQAWPVEWCKSYKAHYLTGQMTDECKILVYHGTPKPHELPTWGGL